MKKSIVLSVVLFFSVAAGYSQHLSVNLFGGYTFRDKLDFYQSYAYINGGGMFGASIEGVNTQGTGLELLYQYQSTAIPVYTYLNNAKVADNSSSVVSYLLLNFEQYYMNNPKVMPYGGIGFGVAFYKGNSPNTSSDAQFAWDLKGGVKIMAASKFGIKIGAQLLGSAKATGTSFYVPYPGYVYPYTTYTTILQFGLTGGLVFDLGGH